MARIVWLASFPKSGNTWLRAFLHALVANLRDRTDDPVDLNALGRLTAAEAMTEHYRPFDPRPPAAWSRADVAAMRPRVHAALAGARPGRVFVKTHCALTMNHGHPTVAMAVTAAAVYLVRDPRDVAVSLAHHTGLGIDHTIAIMGFPGAFTDTSATYVTEPRGSWSENVASWTAAPHPALHIARYEDLHAHPRAAFGAIARFLDLEAPAEAIARAVDRVAFDALADQERREGFREATTGPFFRQGRVGAWRDVLSPAQTRAIVDRHGAQMERFGYGPGGIT